MLAHNYSPTLAHTSLHRRRARVAGQPRAAQFCPHSAAIRKMKRNRIGENDFADWYVAFLHAHPTVPLLTWRINGAFFRRTKTINYFFQKINLFSAMISANCQLLSLHINRSVHIFYFIPFAHVILNFSSTFRFIFPRVIIFILSLLVLRRVAAAAGVIKMFLVRGVSTAALPSGRPTGEWPFVVVVPREDRVPHWSCFN